MLKALTQRLPFRRRRSSSSVSSETAPLTIDMLQGGDLELEDVPRYPPFAKGLPVAPLHHVMATQTELIQRIRMALGLRSDQFQELVVPVLCRYADFVHLLPASEAHHHRGAGGLFRHGLEVAFWAAQASEATIFTLDGTPQERRDNEPRWRLAVCLGGLLHDVGKPLYDVSVTDRTGKLQWNPFEESLTEWATGHRLDRYFLRWNENRHKRHEKFSLLAIERIFTPEIRRYFGKPGPKVFKSLLDALAGTSAQHPVSRLIITADQTSVRRDLVNNRLSVDEHAYGVPVEKYVFDAIRRLVKNGGWKCNEIGAEVWVVHQGVFINWRAAAPRLVSMLEKDDVPGIPRDADTLADILLERGFAIYKPLPGASDEEMAGHRYWEVEPLLLQHGEVSAKVRMLMLRMESPELVFTTEPPAPVEARVIGDVSDQAQPSPNDTTAQNDAVVEGNGMPHDRNGSAKVSCDTPIVAPEQSGTPQLSDKTQDSRHAASEVPASDGAKHMSRPMAIEGSDLLATLHAGAQEQADNEREAATQTDNAPSTSVPTAVAEVSEASVATSDKGAEAGMAGAIPSQGDGLAALAALGQGVGVDFPFATVSEGIARSTSVSQHAAHDAEVGDVTMSHEKPFESVGAGVTMSHPAVDLPVPGRLAQPAPVQCSDNASDPLLDLGPGAVRRRENKTAKPGPVVDSGLMTPSVKSAKRKKRKAKGVTEPSSPIHAPESSATQIGQLLEEEFQRILSGESVLGDCFCMAGTDLAIVYPQGLARMGQPGELIKLLAGHGWLATSPETPDHFVHEREGTSLAVLKGPWAEKALQRLKSLEAELMAELEPAEAMPSVAVDTTAVGQSLLSSSSLEAQAPVKRQRRAHAAPPAATMPEKPEAASRLADVLSAPEMLDNKEEGATESTRLPPAVLDDENSDLAPPKATPERALEMLAEMIRKRSGRWLSGPVSEEGEYLVTSDAAIHLLTGEYPELTKTKLQFAIPKFPGLYRKDNKLYLRKAHG